MSDPPAPAAAPRTIVYWQPGCTSCLRTREFLRERGIEFESINVRESPQAMAELAALGLRSVPVVVRSGRAVLGQDLDELARFLGLQPAGSALPVPVLLARLLALLDAAGTLAAQLPPDVLHLPLPGRRRSHLDLAYHLPCVVAGFLDAAQGGCLSYEHFERKPPQHVATGADTARVIARSSRSLAQWWAANRDRLPETVDTYYGPQSLHGVLERTTWHVAQHLRQLESLLLRAQVVPAAVLGAALLKGLPLPLAVWDAEPADPKSGDEVSRSA